MEKENSEDYREFIVKAVHVWIAGGILVILCAAFFFLGRWYERRISAYEPDSRSAAGDSSRTDPDQKAGASEDLGESLSFFDKLPKENPSDLKFKIEQTTQEEKKVQNQASSERKAEGQVSGEAGSYAIQVLVAKDKASAQKVVKDLVQKGYSASIREEKGKAGTSFKVRVGRFVTKEEAGRTVARLKRDGFTTWVIKTD